MNSQELSWNFMGWFFRIDLDASICQQQTEIFQGLSIASNLMVLGSAPIYERKLLADKCQMDDHCTKKTCSLQQHSIGPCKPKSDSWIPSISNLNPESLHVWIQNLVVLKFESRICGPFEIWIQNPWTPPYRALSISPKCCLSTQHGTDLSWKRTAEQLIHSQ